MLTPLLRLALALLVCGCTPDPIVGDGSQRVISLSPGLTGIVLALGGGDLLVGVDRYSAEVVGAESLPSLGGLFAPDLERAVGLRPTLVLAVASEQQNPFFEQLRARGVEVRAFSAHTLEEVFESYREVGRLIGREAEPLVARVRAELAAVAASVEGRARPTVALVVERDPLYVVANGTFVHALIEAAGGINAFGDLDARYPQVSLELLAERAPDVLIDSAVPDADPAGVRQARAYWERFDWVKRVEFIAPGVATLPGAHLGEGARLLRARLHPELATEEGSDAS